MKEKIIAAIKARFPNVNLSKKRLDQIAAVIAEDVIDDESKIDAAINTYNKYNPLTELAKNDADMRGLNKKVSDLEGKSSTTKTDSGAQSASTGSAATTAADDDTPAWAKALIDANKTLANDLAVLKGEKTADTVRSKAAEKLKDVPASYWSKRALPENLEGLDAFVDEVKADFTAFSKELTDKGLGSMQRPAAGGGGSATGTAGAGKVSPDVEKFVKSREGKAVSGISISGPTPATPAKTTVTV